ncbi:hypothetical protein BDV98DRAFT_577596 [Pterulicium gracile]|uniref:Uncharacterized protein n=1 Tax=Pterulicium gracile TaxID=1884261 RepID=A0A5C3Q5R6_9AGAR|nr:hypothetical protein BDV98DRAFT_577596 [Pterula gracilis]
MPTTHLLSDDDEENKSQPATKKQRLDSRMYQNRAGDLQATHDWPFLEAVHDFAEYSLSPESMQLSSMATELRLSLTNSQALALATNTLAHSDTKCTSTNKRTTNTDCFPRSSEWSAASERQAWGCLQGGIGGPCPIPPPFLLRRRFTSALRPLSPLCSLASRYNAANPLE